MGQPLNFERRIYLLKAGEHFSITGRRQREAVCRAVKTLRRAGLLKGEVKTIKQMGDTFKVVAI